MTRLFGEEPDWMSENRAKVQRQLILESYSDGELKQEMNRREVEKIAKKKKDKRERERSFEA